MHNELEKYYISHPKYLYNVHIHKYVHKCIYEDISNQKSNTGLESNNQNGDITLNQNKVFK